MTDDTEALIARLGAIATAAAAALRAAKQREDELAQENEHLRNDHPGRPRTMPDGPWDRLITSASRKNEYIEQLKVQVSTLTPDAESWRYVMEHAPEDLDGDAAAESLVVEALNEWQDLKRKDCERDEQVSTLTTQLQVATEALKGLMGWIDGEKPLKVPIPNVCLDQGAREGHVQLEREDLLDVNLLDAALKRTAPPEATYEPVDTPPTTQDKAH
jgi:hypothetical protein